MPEIGEVARVVHYLKKHTVGRTINAIKTEDDPIVYGKGGTSAAEFQEALTGKRVVDVRQQGKYFWMVMDSPPHPLMHLGMTGWIKFSNDDTAYYRPVKEEEKVWPPKFMKFILEIEGSPDCQVAFVDPRRLGRVRLVNVDADKMRQTTPLKENGPDPIVDKDILTREWLKTKLNSKKVPIKALLLDQANISGVGNWVGDEVLYQAKIHPEQYSNTFDDEQIGRLHDALFEVCQVACETLADSSQFPKSWLMHYRWSKGKTNANTLPTGEKITFLKVGGRTSAVVLSVQKKTGAVASDVKKEDEEDEKPKARGKQAKQPAPKKKDLDDDEDEKPKARGKQAKKPAPQKAKAVPKSKGKKRKDIASDEESEEESEDEPEEESEEESEEEKPKKATLVRTQKASKPAATSNGDSKKRKGAAVKEPRAKATKKPKQEEPAANLRQRRSTRIKR